VRGKSYVPRPRTCARRYTQQTAPNGSTMAERATAQFAINEMVIVDSMPAGDFGGPAVVTAVLGSVGTNPVQYKVRYTTRAHAKVFKVGADKLKAQPTADSADALRPRRLTASPKQTAPDASPRPRRPTAAPTQTQGKQQKRPAPPAGVEALLPRSGPINADARVCCSSPSFQTRREKAVKHTKNQELRP